MQDDESFAIGRTEETLAGNNQAMRASNWDLESSLYLKFGRTEDDNLSGLLNVCVDVLTGRIVHSPARAAGKRNGHDHPHLVDGNNGDGGIHAGRIADIEHEEVVPDRVVRQSIRTLTDLDSTEQRLVRTAVDAHPSTATIRRKEKILLAVDQDTGNGGHIWKGVQIGVGNAVDDLNAISSCVGDIKAGCGRLASVDVRVVEACLFARREGNETYSGQRHGPTIFVALEFDD